MRGDVSTRGSSDERRAASDKEVLGREGLSLGEGKRWTEGQQQQRVRSGVGEDWGGWEGH